MKRLIWFLLAVLTINFVSADSIYTDQINFEPTGSRLHNQVVRLSNISNVTVVSDSRFNLTGSNPVATTVGDNLTWTDAASIEFNLTSPTSCTEGDVFRMPVYINGLLFSSFTFICVPDSKIVDYKAEYGHGDSNYLSDDYRYLPNSDLSLFNLIRVYTYGSYFNPNEDGLNATITCHFPDYLVMTRQKNEGTDIVHYDGGINATFYWTSLFGNWFRVAPLEQELTNLSAGDYYNITCNEVTYQYSTGQIRAYFDNVSFEIRTTTPLNVTVVTDYAYNSLRYYMTNSEKYPIYNIEFMWKAPDGSVHVEQIEELVAGETVGFEVFLEGNGNLALDASFVPVWYKNSLKPMRYSQAFTSAFNFSTAAGTINDVIGNEGNESRIQFQITDIGKVLSSENYTVEVTLYDEAGNPLVPSSVLIYIKDPDGNLVVNGSAMIFVHNGVYRYNFDSISLQGQWYTEVKVVYNGKEIYLYDTWFVITNPTQVEVQVTCRDNQITCANVMITNEGVEAYEYIYWWWTTPDETLDYTDNGVIDKGQASKLVKAGDTFTVEKCIKAKKGDAMQYFRAKTYYGEYSYATDSFKLGDVSSCKAGTFTKREIIPGISNAVLLPLLTLPILLVIVRRRRFKTVLYGAIKKRKDEHIIGEEFYQDEHLVRPIDKRFKTQGGREVGFKELDINGKGDFGEI